MPGFHDHPLPPFVDDKGMRSEEMELAIKRRVVAWVDMHKYCPRHGCRRAGACQSATFVATTRRFRC